MWADKYGYGERWYGEIETSKGYFDIEIRSLTYAYVSTQSDVNTCLRINDRFVSMCWYLKRESDTGQWRPYKFETVPNGMGGRYLNYDAVKKTLCRRLEDPVMPLEVLESLSERYLPEIDAWLEANYELRLQAEYNYRTYELSKTKQAYETHRKYAVNMRRDYIRAQRMLRKLPPI